MPEIWKRDFPVTTEDESYITRRELTKFLGLTSVAFFMGTLTAAGRSLWSRAFWRRPPALRVANMDEVPAGGYKLFRYPTEDDPCILLRLDQDRFAAFNQHCTHLACPVFFNSAEKQLVCPCHKGFFSAEDGRVLAGPPKRPLEALAVSIRNTEIWVQSSELENL